MHETNLAILLICLAPLAVALLTTRSAVTALERKVDRVTAKLDALLTAQGLDPNPPAHFSAQVRNAAAAGKKIEAIKLLRQETGLSLYEAKVAIEKLMG